jgi:hypothetical protein
MLPALMGISICDVTVSTHKKEICSVKNDLAWQKSSQHALRLLR